MNQEQINKDLKENKTADSPFQTAVMELYRSFITRGSDEMSRYWGRWDKNHRNYQGYRVPDKEDVENVNKGGTEKIIIPLSYAQAQTAAAGILNMYMQKEVLFELMSYGPEDQKNVMAMERVLDYQVRQNKIYRKLYTYILDALIKGVSGFRVDWEKITKKYRVREKVETQSVFTDLLAPLGLGGLVNRLIPSETSYNEVVKELTQYEGNVIDNLNMYSFFPDPSVPLKDFQKGSFCAVEQVYPLTNVKDEEGKLYHGTDKVTDSFNLGIWNTRKHYGGLWDITPGMTDAVTSRVSAKKSVSLVEMYIRLIPKEFTEKYKIDIGDDEDSRMFVIVIANDEKIIRFEPYNELHGRFPFAIGQFSPDPDDYIGQSMVDLLSGLQSFITWLINSHMKAVRQTVNNRFIVDPTKIEVGDIESGSTVIRTRLPGPMQNAIQQLSVVDVTANHIPFVNSLQGIAQLITGINENAMGQYSGGRRSAAQTRSIVNAGQVRLGMIANLLWEGIEEMGIIILSNTQQFLSEEAYNQILGEAAEKYPFSEVILAKPEQIAAAYNFAPLEAMSESNKSFIFQMFKELVSSPEVVQVANLDPNKLLEYMFNLAGVKNYDWFKQAQAEAPAPAPNVQVMPDNAVQQMAQAGQAQPMGAGTADILGQAFGA